MAAGCGRLLLLWEVVDGGFLAEEVVPELVVTAGYDSRVAVTL